MREWIPVSTSPKGRLALAAVREFGARPFEDVTVGELAAAARVTTGAIYHHFGSKLGLYAFVREDVERRLLDRMEGALATGAGAGEATRPSGVASALVVGFDFAVREGFSHLVGAPPAEVGRDPFAELVGVALGSSALGQVLAAAWRAALVVATEDGRVDEARAALLALGVREAASGSAPTGP